MSSQSTCVARCFGFIFFCPSPPPPPPPPRRLILGSGGGLLDPLRALRHEWSISTVKIIHTSNGIIIHDKARILSTLLSLFKYFSSSSLMVCIFLPNASSQAYSFKTWKQSHLTVICLTYMYPFHKSQIENYVFHDMFSRINKYMQCNKIY